MTAFDLENQNLLFPTGWEWSQEPSCWGFSLTPLCDPHHCFV